MTAGATPPGAQPAPVSGPPAAPAAAGQSGSPTVGEIVVTALKRSTALQKTPMAITAVTGDTLREAGIDNIVEFAKSVPSLSLVTSSPGSDRVVIRGIQSAGEPTVGLYYDETPVPGTPGAGSDAGGSTPELRLFDVQRVEVLRGPQGTLYGSGSMGGTLRVIFNKPKNDYEGAVEGSAYTTTGGAPGYEVNAMGNVPLIDNKLAARVVGFYRDEGGYVDNAYLHLNNDNRNVSWGGRFMLRATPIDRLTVDFDAFIQRVNSFSYLWNTAAGRNVSTFRAILPIEDDINLYSITAKYDADLFTVTAVGSFFKRHFITSSDTSQYIANLDTPANCQRFHYGTAGGPCNAAQLTTFNAHIHTDTPSYLRPDQHESDYNGELRIGSNWQGPFHITAGLYAEDRKSRVDNPEVAVDPATGQMYQPAQEPYLRIIFDELKQEAVFGEISYDLLHNLTATFGGRYFHYTRDISGETPIPLDLVGAVYTPLTTVSSAESGEVYKFNLSYQFTPRILFYAEASEGFRPGGANQVLGLPSALTPYQSDSLWDYEIGTKTGWFHNRFVFDVDAFLIDWNNIQVSGQTPNGAFSFISNAGAAQIKGIEAETTLAPFAGLQIQANLSMMDPRLTQDQVNANLNAPGRKGDRIPYIPEITGDVSAEYTWRVSNDLHGIARGDVNYVGSSYSQISPLSVYETKIPAASLLNLRVGVENQKWGIYLFANNVLNRTDILTDSRSAISVNELAVSARPRTIGIDFRDRF